MRKIIQHKFFIVLSDECKELPQEKRNKLASAAWKLKNEKGLGPNNQTKICNINKTFLTVI